MQFFIFCWLLWKAIPRHVRRPLPLIVAVVVAGRIYFDSWLPGVGVLAGMWLVLFAIFAVRRRRAAFAVGLSKPGPLRLARAYSVEWLRKARVRRQWTKLAVRRNWTVEKGAGAKPLPVRKVKATPAGDVTVVLDPGKVGLKRDDVESEASLLANTTKCQEVEVRRDRRRQWLSVTFFFTNPLERVLTIADSPWIDDPMKIAYAVNQDGSPGWFQSELPVLVGGVPGSGKSSLFWAYLADHIRKNIPVQVWAGDLKGGMEMGALEHYLEHPGPNPAFTVGGYATTPKDTTAMVKELWEKTKIRQSYLRRNNLRMHTPSIEHPKIVLALDEMLALSALCKAGMDGPLGQIASQGRAAFIVPFGLAQMGHAEELGTIRNVFVQRACGAMPTSFATDTIMGDHATASGALCHELDKVIDRGIFYAPRHDQHGFTKQRVAYVSSRPYDEDNPDEQSDLSLIVSGQLPRGMRVAADESRKFCIYLAWGHEDKTGGREFEYVGRSTRDRVKDRIAEHRRKEQWWRDEVDESTIVIKDYDTKAAMLTAEKEHVEELRPIHNRAMNQGNPWRRDPKTSRLDEARKRFTVIEGEAAAEDVAS